MGTDETWVGIDTALSRGQRGHLGRFVTRKTAAEHRGVRNHRNLPPLTIEQILAWADAHKAATGRLAKSEIWAAWQAPTKRG